MGKVVYYISTIFFILLFLNVTSLSEKSKVEENTQNNCTYIYQKNDKSCKENLDILYGNHFINIIQLIDCNSYSKSSYIKLLIRNISIIKSYLSNKCDITLHSTFSITKFISTRTYYIYALRRIII